MKEDDPENSIYVNQISALMLSHSTVLLVVPVFLY